jgi:hypothetical protein
LPFNQDLKLSMRDANGGTKTTFGVVENLDIQINGVSIMVHAWIIENALYHILLGWPFQLAAREDTEDAGDILIVNYPKCPGHHLRIPMQPHSSPHLPQSHFFSLDEEEATSVYQVNSVIASRAICSPRSPCLSWVISPLSRSYLVQTYNFTVPALGIHYKPVDRKIHPVPTTLPEAARPKR